jgi:hypothetical protein
METKSNNISLRAILFAIGLGIWVMVLQNAGVIPTKQNVYVKGGNIAAEVNGTVDVRGSVDVDNTVDINIREVQGRNVGSRRSYTIDGVEYNSLDVSAR